MTRLYARVLRLIGLVERRCAWCGSLLGWRRGTYPAGRTTHGICSRCVGTHFSDDEQKAA